MSPSWWQWFQKSPSWEEWGKNAYPEKPKDTGDFYKQKTTRSGWETNPSKSRLSLDAGTIRSFNQLAVMARQEKAEKARRMQNINGYLTRTDPQYYYATSNSSNMQYATTSTSYNVTASITSTGSVTTTAQPTQDVMVYHVAVPPGATEVKFAITGEEMARNMPRRRMPAPREFNPFINASDQMEEFIKWVGSEGVKADEVMSLPVELFVKWLVVRACEADGEEPNVELVIPEKKQPRCVSCKRFMPRQIEVPLHDRCAPRYFEKRGQRELVLT